MKKRNHFIPSLVGHKVKVSFSGSVAQPKYLVPPKIKGNWHSFPDIDLHSGSSTSLIPSTKPVRPEKYIIKSKRV